MGYEEKVLSSSYILPNLVNLCIRHLPVDHFSSLLRGILQPFLVNPKYSPFVVPVKAQLGGSAQKLKEYTTKVGSDPIDLVVCISCPRHDGLRRIMTVFTMACVSKYTMADGHAYKVKSWWST